ncbi:MAG: O-antigen ligase family protein [Smithella sp.]
MDLTTAKQRIEYLIFAAVALVPFIFFPVGKNGDFFYAPKAYALVVIAAMFLFILILSGKNIRSLIKFDLINLFLLFYALLLIISLFFAHNIKMAIVGRQYRSEGLMTLLSYFLLFLAARTVTLPGKKLFIRITISATILSIYGIAQFYGFDPFPRDFIRGGWKTAFATFGNPNFFGSYLVLVIPVVLYNCIAHRQVLSGICCAVMIYALVCTLSRGPWIGIGVAISIYIFMNLYFYGNFRQDRRRIIYALLMTVLAVFIFNMTTGNIFSSRLHSISKDAREVIKSDQKVTEDAINRSGATESGLARFYIWEKVIELIKEKPWTGYGIENLLEPFGQKFGKESVAQKLGFGRASHPDKAHNEYLNIAVSTGIPSLIIYFIFIMLVLKRSLVKMRQSPVYVPFAAAVLGYLAQAFFNISVASVAYIFWVFLGLISSYDSQ